MIKTSTLKTPKTPPAAKVGDEAIAKLANGSNVTFSGENLPLKSMEMNAKPRQRDDYNGYMREYRRQKRREKLAAKEKGNLS